MLICEYGGEGWSGDFYLSHFKAHLLNEARYKARFIKESGAREAWRPVPPQREQVINELTRLLELFSPVPWRHYANPEFNVFFFNCVALRI